MNGSDYCFGIDLGTSNSSICYVNPKARHPLPYVHVEAVRVPRDEADHYSYRPIGDESDECVAAEVVSAGRRHKEQTILKPLVRPLFRVSS